MTGEIETRNVETFVLAWLPPPPASVLEVGSGAGDLARRLIEAGYDVTAIDPNATDDDLVRAVSLEAFDADDQYSAAVASRTLHHIHDLDAAIAKIHDFLVDDGYVILNDFGWDRLDEPTGRWLFSQLQTQAGQPLDDHASFKQWLDQWRTEHASLHRSEAMLEILRDRFVECYYAECPYLADEYLDGGSAVVRTEHELIRTGAINAAGFRFVGTSAAWG